MVPLLHICGRLLLPADLAVVLERKGWSVGRLAVLQDDMDNAVPIILEQLRADDNPLQIDDMDLRRLIGCCSMFADLTWKAEESNPPGEVAESYVRNVRARVLESSNKMEKMAQHRILPAKGSAQVIRWPNRRAKLVAQAGSDKSLRESAEEAERIRWVQSLAVLLFRGKTPISQDFAGSSDLASSRRVGKGRRPSTLRKHVKVWEKFIMWLKGACGLEWPNAPWQFVDYLEERASEPCGHSVPLSILKTLMFMESSAEIPKPDQICSHPSVSNVMQEITRFLERASPTETRKANMYPVKVVVALEKSVMNTSRARFVRAMAWFKLVKIWGALRHSDAQGVDYSSMRFSHRGLEATLVRTKTSGPGKAIKTLQLYVATDAWVQAP